jgi:preprotein translocase subunit SecG
MDKWTVFLLIVFACFIFFTLAYLGAIPDYIVKLLPNEAWGGLLSFSVIVVFLFGAITLPFSFIYDYIFYSATSGLSQSQVTMVKWVMFFIVIIILYYFYRKKKNKH